MTKLFYQAVGPLRTVPFEAHDEIAHVVMPYADQPTVRLTPDENADLDEADAEIERGEFATEKQMRAIWVKYDR